MSVELATAYVSIVPSAKGMGKALEREMGGGGAAAGDAASASFGEKFSGGMGSIGKAAAAGLGVALVGAAGLGKVLFDVGSSFDTAYDTIRVGTGKTGLALEGLKQDMKSVATTVPASFADASIAVTDLNQRLGLAGPELKTLATQMLELSRITETDLATNIDSLTRVFGDWEIGVDAMPGALDKVYRATQASGIPLDTLNQAIVQFGAPLRNLGFGFDESVALLAQFNRTGVNTETVFAGMKAGVGKLAKAGEPIPETFARVVDEITKMGPGTDATAKAIELFGQRAGPDLADAIAGGKFEIDGMLDAITNGSDTIAQAGADTGDFAEKLLLLKNQALIRLEPIALRVFGAIGDAVTAAQPFVEKIANGFLILFATFRSGTDDVTSSGFAGTMESVGITLRDAFDKIGPLVGEFVDKIRSVDWAKVFGEVVAVVGPIVDAFVNLAVAVGTFAVEQWPKVEAVLPTLKTVFEFLGTATAIAVNFLADKMNILGPALVGVAVALTLIKAAEGGAAIVNGIKTGESVTHIKQLNSNFDQFLVTVKKAGGPVKRFAVGAKNEISWFASDTKSKLVTAGKAVGDFGTTVKTSIVDNAKKAGTALKGAATSALELGKKMVTSAIGIARNSAAWVANKIAMAASAVATAAQTIATTIATAATAAFNFVMALNPVVLVVIAIVALIAILVLAYTKVDWFRAFVDKAFNAIKDVIVTALDIAWKAIQTVFEVIKGIFTTYVNIWKLIITTAFNVIKYVITNAIEIARDVVSTVFEKIKETIGNAIDGAKLLVEIGMALIKGHLVDPVMAAKDKVVEIFDGIVSLFADLPDKLLAGLSSLADTIAAPFKAMGQAIRDAWNDSVGGKGFDIPDVAGVPNRGERVEIPRLHAGGPVTGRSGAEVLRILEAGEWVLSRDEVARMRSAGRPPSAGPGASGGGFTIERLEVTTVANATADETVDAINAKIGWRTLTTRRDR